MPVRLPRETRPPSICLIVLAFLGGCAGTADLIAETHDEDAETRREAVVCLAEREPSLPEDERDAVYRALAASLADPDPAVRATAVDGVGRFAAPDLDQVLVGPLDDSHPRVRQAAARVAGIRKVVLSLARLLRMAAEDEEEDVRREAVNAVARIGEKSAIPVLIELLDKEESRVRYVINDALRRLSGKSFPPITREWQEWYEREG